MGVILNPRGTCGSGKTELVRRILAAYGWQTDTIAEPNPARSPASGPLQGRGYRLRHPQGGRPLAVLGLYGATSGGCDRIRASEGGLAWVTEQAGLLASEGHDVLMEGLRLSSEVELSLRLARAHPLHVVRLATPAEACAMNLARRRRVGPAALPRIREAVARENAMVSEACERIRTAANVEVLPFDDALARISDLLGCGEARRRPARPPISTPLWGWATREEEGRG